MLDSLAVEVERRHAAHQQFAGFRSELGKFAQLGDGHADVGGDALDFAFGAAARIGESRAVAGPRLPPLSKHCGRRPAPLFAGLNRHVSLLTPRLRSAAVVLYARSAGGLLT